MPTPGLDALTADPGLIGHLPLNALVDLRRRIRYLDAEMEAAITRQMIRESPPTIRTEVLDVKAAAERLNTSPDSLYRKHKRLRLGYIDPLDGRLKFTEQEVNDHVRRQRRA
jgi:hypothetical protein